MYKEHNPIGNTKSVPVCVFVFLQMVVKSKKQFVAFEMSSSTLSKILDKVGDGICSMKEKLSP